MDELILKARQKDHVSHFLLRLAYCRTEESRRWFISHESDLFRFRFSMENSEDMRAFMKENKMNFQPVSKHLCQVNLHVLKLWMYVDFR